jgi:hypothetical protein
MENLSIYVLSRVKNTLQVVMPPAVPGDGSGFFTQARGLLTSGFLALPIILITITGFMATTTANVGMIILFFGQLFLIPFVQYILSWVRSIPMVESVFNLGSTPTYSSYNKICALSPADVFGDMTVPVNSYWMANVVFFMTYILMNSQALYNASTGGCPPGWTDMGFTCQEPITYGPCANGLITNAVTCVAPIIYNEDGSIKGGGQVTPREKLGGSSKQKTEIAGIDTKVENRKAHAMTAFVITLIIFVILITIHYRNVGCETPGSITVAMILYVSLGVGWFYLAEACSLRAADIFGIASQMGAPSAGSQEYPYACVPVPTPSA